MQDSTDKSAIDTPVTRLENQMRHDAGVEGTSEKDSQWRTIASRVVHGHQFDQMGLRNQAASVSTAGKASKSSEKDKLPSVYHQASSLFTSIITCLRLRTSEDNKGRTLHLLKLPLSQTKLPL